MNEYLSRLEKLENRMNRFEKTILAENKELKKSIIKLEYKVTALAGKRTVKAPKSREQKKAELKRNW